mmetsp:Transcript_57827/g.135180  ORF Transcript_57827/g.135180 Transcript_57827/m.135180 type:complete len:389 (+) Transcript_57827:41-1207(+)
MRHAESLRHFVDMVSRQADPQSLRSGSGALHRILSRQRQLYVVTTVLCHSLCLTFADGLAQQMERKQADPGRPLLKQSFLVRYALLDPDPHATYTREVGLPSLESSHCSTETYLAPSLQAADFIQVLPNYVVYTDTRTHPLAEGWRGELPEVARSRVQLVNLDEDADDGKRMAPFLHLRMDQKNLMSVRRTLADGKHLPVEASRLLLGTDISFLAEPQTFLAEARKLLRGQALYMWDDDSFQGNRYKLTDYPGPQCTGLLGDFIFMTPGVSMLEGLLQEKMLWYESQRSGPRVTPECKICDDPFVSGRLHGIDQFATAMALGEATAKGHVPGCVALPASKFHNGVMRPRTIAGLEVVHDKQISSNMCGYQGTAIEEQVGASAVVRGTR